MAPQVVNPDDRRLWKDELVKIERDRSAFHVSPGYRPEIQHVSMDQPLIWIKKGWRDLERNPVIAIGYGALVALIYGAIVAFALATGLYGIGVQLTAGFILLAPVMALGFYAVSRKNERGESVEFLDTFRIWRRNHKGLLGMGVLLVLLFLSWFMLSMWTTAFLADSEKGLGLFLGSESFGEFYTTLMASLTLPMVLWYFLVGLATVLLVFAFTAVSIPMMMDHPETDAITALVASWEAVTHNWKPMLWWAVLIAFFTGIGLVFFYVGLVITLPILGFATWHAYRDTLGEWRKVEEPQPPYY